MIESQHFRVNNFVEASEQNPIYIYIKIDM